MSFKKQSLLFFSILLLAFCSSNALAKDYPSKDITNIIPWSAGGGTDAAVRGFMHHSEKALGVKVFNKNVTGAQSGIGTFKLMNSRPDGYTIGALTWDSVITVPYYKLIPGYDISKLSFLGTMTLHSTILIVPTDSPWKNIGDMVADAKKNPGKFTVSNVGTGGVWHLPILDFASKAGIDLRYIPYPKGSATQREALLNGETNAACMSVTAAYPAIKAGKARIIGVMSAERDAMIPEVPTFKESGYDVIWGSFRVLAAPVKTPQKYQDKLEQSFAKVYDSAEFNTWAAESKLGAHWMNAKDTSEFIVSMQTKAFALLDDLIARGILKK